MQTQGLTCGSQHLHAKLGVAVPDCIARAVQVETGGQLGLFASSLGPGLVGDPVSKD